MQISSRLLGRRFLVKGLGRRTRLREIIRFNELVCQSLCLQEAFSVPLRPVLLLKPRLVLRAIREFRVGADPSQLARGADVARGNV